MIFFDDHRDATLLNDDEKDGLLLPMISTQGELNLAERANIADAYEWLDKKRSRSNLITAGFMQELHYRMFCDVWSWAGQFRTSEKNIGIREYWRIPMSLRNLCEDTQVWIDQQTFGPDETACRFHHRLVLIHCFANGNGRHARLMADLILENIYRTDP